MKLIKKARKNGTFRLQSVPVGPSKTDQSDKNMVNINTIMANYAKTGLLPQFPEKVAQYMDTTQIPSYMEAQAQIAHARELFQGLPSEIRKEMNNNPQNLEHYLKNPDNHEKLIGYGILKQEKVEPVAPVDPTSDSASESTKGSK